jgi:hypothetical protein
MALIFFYFLYNFNMLMLKIKKNKKYILMHFQLKNTFKKYIAPQYQIYTE